MPVYAWLQEARLQKARRLLTGGESSVTQISLAVGYSSLSHFSALFRRCFGVSPSSQQGRRPTKSLYLAAGKPKVQSE